jgi:hypothetical protein
MYGRCMEKNYSINYNLTQMKKTIFITSILFALITSVTAQSSKTNLSLQVSAATAANRAQLASYVWTRTVQVYIEGELKNTIVSAMSIGPDGKMVTTAVSSTPTGNVPTKGIRGKIAKGKIDDMKEYVNNGIKTSMGYLYLSKGKMVDYFDAAIISQSGNTISVLGSNVNQKGDQLMMNLTAGTLAMVNQGFKSTVTGGDPISGTLNYKTFENGLTALDHGELNLPAKTMKLVIVNSSYAKKLQ